MRYFFISGVEQSMNGRKHPISTIIELESFPTKKRCIEILHDLAPGNYGIWFVAFTEMTYEDYQTFITGS